ncbi:unnamed protein product, partial [Ixodes pacificus]
ISVLISVSPPQIDILHMDDVLCDSYSLMDVAYIYAWKRDSPLRLAFRVYPPSAMRPTPTETTKDAVDVDARDCSGDPGGQQQCPREQLTAPGRPVPECLAAASVKEGVAQSVASPEMGAGPPALVPRDVLKEEEEEAAAFRTVVPAAETSRPATTDGMAATEGSAATGIAQAASPVRSSSPQQEQRQKASEPPAQSPPALSKITISTLDRSSNKITIQTKEVPPAVAQAMSPPRSPLSKKSRRKEQRDAERTLQHARHQERPPDSQDAKRPRRPRSRSPERPDGATPAKNARLNGADIAEVDAADGRRVSRSASPGRLVPERASLPEPAQRSQNLAENGSGPGSPGTPVSPPRAHPQTPRTPPAAPPLGLNATKSHEDTRPLDLSVSHRGLPAPAPVRRPVGRPPLVLPTAGPPGTAKGTSLPSPYRRAASSPAVSLFQKPAVAVNHAAASSPLPQQHHHHHSHHRSSSRGFLKGANLTCINPDPDAFHPRIVIKNLPPRASGASFHRM